MYICIYVYTYICINNTYKSCVCPPSPSPQPQPYSHYRQFLRLSDPLKRVMNSLAREIWRNASELDVVLWIQYVNTKCNIAEELSREIPFPLEGICMGIRAGTAYRTHPS